MNSCGQCKSFTACQRTPRVYPATETNQSQILPLKSLFPFLFNTRGNFRLIRWVLALSYLRVRESRRERGDNLFPRCALIRGMHETSNADWWDASVTWQLSPLSLSGSLGSSLPPVLQEMALWKLRNRIVFHFWENSFECDHMSLILHCRIFEVCETKR